MALTNQAKKDFQKIFNKNISNEDYSKSYKVNWHKNKIKNKHRELKKRSKKHQFYSKYFWEKSTETNYYSNELGLSVQSFNELVEQIDEHTTKSLKNKYGYTKFQKQTYNYIPVNCNPIIYNKKEVTKVYKKIYLYTLKNKYDVLYIKSNKELIHLNGYSTFDKDYLIDLFKENKKHLELIHFIPYKYKFRKFKETKSITDKTIENYINVLAKNTNLDEYLEYESKFFKENPQYIKLSKEIDKEIHFHSGMRRESKGKSKYRKIERDIINHYNYVVANNDYWGSSKKEILYDEMNYKNVFICDCKDCIETFGNPIAIDVYFLINSENSHLIDELSVLYGKYKDNLEKWEYIY